MTLEDLQALYDLARTAPLKQAMFAKQVSELFDKVEAEIQRAQVQRGLELAKAELSKQLPKDDAA
jgi:hypothetical protein